MESIYFKFSVVVFDLKTNILFCPATIRLKSVPTLCPPLKEFPNVASALEKVKVTAIKTHNNLETTTKRWLKEYDKIFHGQDVQNLII